MEEVAVPAPKPVELGAAVTATIVLPPLVSVVTDASSGMAVARVVGVDRSFVVCAATTAVLVLDSASAVVVGLGVVASSVEEGVVGVATASVGLGLEVEVEVDVDVDVIDEDVEVEVDVEVGEVVVAGDVSSAAVDVKATAAVFLTSVHLLPLKVVMELNVLMMSKLGPQASNWMKRLDEK